MASNAAIASTTLCAVSACVCLCDAACGEQAPFAEAPWASELIACPRWSSRRVPRQQEGTDELKRDLAAIEDTLPPLFDAHTAASEAYTAEGHGLRVLEQPLAALVECIPHAAGSPIAQLPCTATLREALDKLEALNSERDERLSGAITLEGKTFSVAFERPASGAGLTVKDTRAGFLGVAVSSRD